MPAPLMAPSLVLPRLGPGPTVVVVGFPAPAAVAIVERLLATDARTVACVVSRDRWPEATRLNRAAQSSGRLRLFEGSASQPGLGLAHTAWRLLDTADEIYGVVSAQEIETRHLQDFADECPRLRDLHLVPQDPAGTGGRGGRLASLRRVIGSAVPAPLRPSVGRVTRALAQGVAGIARVGPVVRAARPWTDVLDLDIEAALSWEDVERDLWPGQPD